jgi:hypothetical protein
MVFLYFLLVDGMVRSRSRIQIWIRIQEAQKLPDPASNNIKADISGGFIHSIKMSEFQANPPNTVVHSI